MKFSANLGFLWADRPLTKAIHAAAAAGFDAVELHWPYDTPASSVAAALQDTGLPVLGLNTSRGDVAAGDNGLSAIPDRQDEARKAIDQAVAYGAEIGARNVHVMAGYASGEAAHDMFLSNLEYASDVAASAGLSIVIEPLNQHDAPGYFLQTTDQAAQIIATLARDNLRLMFDCYHVGRTEGDVLGHLARHFPIIGHIQIAAVPDRGAPDHGTFDYHTLYAALRHLGWAPPIGAEYKPGSDTDLTLDWLFAAKGP